VALSNVVVILSVCLIKLCVCTTGIVKAPEHRLGDMRMQRTQHPHRCTHSGGRKLLALVCLNSVLAVRSAWLARVHGQHKINLLNPAKYKTLRQLAARDPARPVQKLRTRGTALLQGSTRRGWEAGRRCVCNKMAPPRAAAAGAGARIGSSRAPSPEPTSPGGVKQRSQVSAAWRVRSPRAGNRLWAAI